MLVHHLF